MNINKFRNVIKKIPSGKFFRLTYISFPQVTSEAQARGIVVTVITSKTVYFPFTNSNENYGNNRIAVRDVNGTSETYMCCKPIQGPSMNPRRTFLVNGKAISETILMSQNLVVPSYWSHRNGTYNTIKLDNILSVKQKSKVIYNKDPMPR